MAGRDIAVFTDTQVVLTNAAKTILQILAPASFGLAIRRAVITFDNPNTTDEQLAAYLYGQDQDGTGSAQAVSNYGGKNFTGSPQATGKENFTAEPTTDIQLAGPIEITPQGGLVWTPPGGVVFIEPGKAFGITALQRTTATTNLKASAYIIAEE